MSEHGLPERPLPHPLLTHHSPALTTTTTLPNQNSDRWGQWEWWWEVVVGVGWVGGDMLMLEKLNERQCVCLLTAVAGWTVVMLL